MEDDDDEILENDDNLENGNLLWNTISLVEETGEELKTTFPL